MEDIWERSMFRNELAWRSASRMTEWGPQWTNSYQKTVKIPAKQLTTTFLELGKLTKATEQTENHLSERNNWTVLRKWDQWYFNLWMHPIPLPPQLRWVVSTKSQPMERTDLLWSSLKTNTPRAQSIFCLNLELPGKSLFLGSCGYLIWLRVQLNRKKITLLAGHYQNNSHPLAT